jgi:hypothetical protein
MKPHVFNPLVFPDGLTIGGTETSPCVKLRFSKREAEANLRQAVQAARFGNFYRREQHSYQCPRCGWWHLTSAEQWEKQSEEEGERT